MRPLSEPFDPTELERTLVLAHGPKQVKAIIAGDPRKQAVADKLFADVAAAPPLTVEQRAVIRGIFRAAATLPTNTAGGGPHGAA